MIAFMLLFFPAVLTNAIYEKLQKAPLSRKRWLYHFCGNSLFINLVCFAIKQILLKTGDAPLYTLNADITPHAAMNYLLIAIPTAVILCFFQVLLNKHTKVEVEEKE